MEKALPRGSFFFHLVGAAAVAASPGLFQEAVLVIRRQVDAVGAVVCGRDCETAQPGGIDLWTLELHTM